MKRLACIVIFCAGMLFGAGLPGRAQTAEPSLILEAFAGAGTYPGLGAVIGCGLSPAVFLGAGTNVKVGPTTGGSTFLPFFADFRASFGRGRWAPYIGADLGGAAHFVSGEKTRVGPFGAFTAGARMRSGSSQSLWLGADVEGSADLFFAGLRIGYSF